LSKISFFFFKFIISKEVLSSLGNCFNLRYRPIELLLDNVAYLFEMEAMRIKKCLNILSRIYIHEYCLFVKILSCHLSSFYLLKRQFDIFSIISDQGAEYYLPAWVDNVSLFILISFMNLSTSFGSIPLEISFLRTSSSLCFFMRLLTVSFLSHGKTTHLLVSFS